MDCRKDFKPTIGHRVCSEHFVGGKKTYLNNVPTLTPKIRKSAVPRATSKARNRTLFVEDCRGDSPPHILHEICGEEAPLKDCPSYAISKSEESSMTEIAELKKENCTLSEENSKLRSENILLVNRLAEIRGDNLFSIENLKNDKKLFMIYAGLEDYETFKAIFDSFGPAVNNLIYHNSGTNSANIVSPGHIKRGPKRRFSPEIGVFIVLVRLRLGLLEADIANGISFSVSHVLRICTTWFDFLYNRFRQIPIWPSRNSIAETMPSCFRDIYPSTRVVIDCTELYIERTSSVRSQSTTYSSYKHHNTAKDLIGITLAESVSFVFDLYAGRTSDKQATKDCGILKLLENGDSIMADMAFAIGNPLSLDNYT